jgi:peptide chain release factor 3
MTAVSAAAGHDAAVAREAGRRRTVAIISHPDAGKTTLTEKLLLFGGAIHLAGAVKARRAQRHATSDWMELERQRGISVSSSVMTFEIEGVRVNLLDTPGHGDFSEDTYRTLMAADSAIMLLDNRKGVEERTRQLFAVSRRRRIPIFTFVNKCDRAGLDPLQLMSDVERDLGIACSAVTWPVYVNDRLAGIYDRNRRVVRLEAGGGGARRSESEECDMESLRSRLEPEAWRQLSETVQLLETAGHPLDVDEIRGGTQTPVYFGSALNSVGVEAFLLDFLRLAPPPSARESTAGPVQPASPAFTGFVFKIQANMDPRHRDRVAFVRVCSGRYQPGLEVLHVRAGRTIRLAAAQQFMARDRTMVDDAWPGDVVGIVDRGMLRIGDTLSAAGSLEFPGIPRFPPEHFAQVVVADALRRKQLDKGLRELSEEGAAQVYYAAGTAGASPIVGAVGLLQFDVMLFRLQHEYGASCRLVPMGYKFPRWVVGDPVAIARAASVQGRLLLHDIAGRPLLVFENSWSLATALEQDQGISFHEVAP